MRRVKEMSSSTLLKQEVGEIGLNLSVPGFGMGTIVLEVQALVTYISLEEAKIVEL